MTTMESIQMKNRYEKNYTIGPSDCDHRSVLSIPAAFDIFMDMAAEHAENLGVGTKFMMETGNFWLTAKTRIHFIKRPHMMQNVILETWPHEPRGAQDIRDYRIKSVSGDVLVEGKTQWAVLNTKTGSLVKVGDIFPEGFTQYEETMLPEPFARISENVADCEEYASYKVRSVDIDLGGHMNNVAYVRALFGTFTSKELDALDIKDCEICYKQSCYEGDVLKYYKRVLDDGMEVIVLNEDSRAVILAKLR